MCTLVSELIYMLSVQIFGVKNSQATRAAERFFKERRVTIHFVDLQKRPLALGEIRRFIERFGLAGLLDTEGTAYTDAGLKISQALRCGTARTNRAGSEIAPVAARSGIQPAERGSR